MNNRGAHCYAVHGTLTGCAISEVPDILAIQSFFASADYARALSALVGPEPDDRNPGLDMFVAKLENASKANTGWTAGSLKTKSLSRRVS